MIGRRWNKATNPYDFPRTNFRIGESIERTLYTIYIQEMKLLACLVLGMPYFIKIMLEIENERTQHAVTAGGATM